MLTALTQAARLALNGDARRSDRAGHAACCAISPAPDRKSPALVVVDGADTRALSANNTQSPAFADQVKNSHPVTLKPWGAHPVEADDLVRLAVLYCAT